MSSLCPLLALVVTVQATTPPGDIGSRLINAGDLSQKAARLMRIDAVSQLPAVRQELRSMAKSLSSMGVNMINWGKLIKARPGRNPYPLLQRDFQFAESFVKTLDELLAPEQPRDEDELDRRMRAALSPATKRKLHDLREIYAQTIAETAASRSKEE
jgi:hypothetical protein